MNITRKGIILAGGSGSRLSPVTNVVSKQLLNIYDKPLIYYSLSVLMLCQVQEILLISTPSQIDNYKLLFKDGKHLGLKIEYKVQKYPSGIADAFNLGRKFLNNNPAVLILGDNIFYGHNLSNILINVSRKNTNTIFGYKVENPERYGVVKFDKNNSVISIEEKPKNFISKFAVPGIYFYDENVCDIVKSIKPSNRGELEITDVNLTYLKLKKLQVEILGRGITWVDAGTFESMLEASMLVSSIQKRQGSLICSPEEIAFQNNWISKIELKYLADSMGKNSYSNYLHSLVD